MAAVQCDNFVGNAWKKDLCLNCFKSKEEHVMKNGHSHLIPTRIPDPPKEGILKGTKLGSQTPKGNKVIFLNKEYEIIGFGGDDVYSDEEDYPDFSNNSQAEDDDEIDSEEDKAFQKLTKSNTDYNSIPENLQEPKQGEVKKIIEPLKLGKQVLDEKGNKKTLLVSVTPFGDQTAVKNKVNVNGFKTNTFAEKETKTINGHQANSESINKLESNKKELIVPAKTKAVEEKTEPIVNGESNKENTNKTKCLNGDPEKSEKSIDIAQNEDTSGKQTNDKSLKRSQPLDKNFKFRLSKDLQKENEKNVELNGKEANGLKSEKTKNSEKVNSLVDKAKKKINGVQESSKFTFKNKENENKKAVVLDIYKIQENGDSKTQNGVHEEKIIKSIITPSEARNNFLSQEIKPSSGALEISTEKLSNGEDPKCATENNYEKQQNISTIDRSKLVPNVSSLYRHHFKNVKSLEENKSEPVVKPLMNGVVSLVPNIECTFSENDKKVSECEEIINGVAKENGTDDVSKESRDDKFKKTSFDSFENFENIIKGEEITLFSAEEKVKEEEEEEKLEKREEEKEEIPVISRESAGEPDGRADSDDLSEPPALPSKPPPPLTESRSNFLHDLTGGADGMKMVSEKPKVPAKPIIIQSKKINFQSPIHSNRPKSPSVEKFLDATASPQMKPHAPLQESLSSDSNKNQKRQAPKPPSPKENSEERLKSTILEVETSEPAVKENEVEEPIVKRISRSTENLLEFITSPEEKDQLSAEGLEEISVPEPLPRRSLSLSQDSLMPGETGDAQLKKKPSRGRFFLRKLLHLGKPKESNSKDLSVIRQKYSLPPTSKPKIEIIHPSDLNGSRVEVVPPVRTSKSRRTSSSASSSSGEQRESDVLSDSSTSHSVSSSGNDSQSTIDRSKKPPPPPRAHSLDTWSNKPARPPPPKSIDILRQANSTWTTSVDTKPDNLYVNLGEARSGLAPNKPVRTGSLREANLESSKRLVTVVSQPEDSDYESFVVTPVQYSTLSQPTDDNLYECVQMSGHRSSLPECDSTPTESPNSTYTKGKRTTNNRNNTHRRSEGNVDVSSEYFKMKFVRSTSLPYCASETESEIYSPYSFYGSEIGEEDFESSNHALRMSRLKLKKGRSIVHKNLEDNYGAVIVANHEALTQVVEQMRQGPVAPPALRALSTAVNLRWTDFSIAKDAVGVVVERRIFYPAFWGAHAVTLSLMAEQGLNSSFHAKGPFNLNPLTELNDLIPASYLPMLKKDSSELIQASISVLTRLQIETVESYGKSISNGFLSEESKKEINFVILQIINALKTLQAQGIEEAPKNLTNLVVCREERDPHPRICITHSFDRSEEETSKFTLCQCVTHAIQNILPQTDLTPLISSILQKEKAVSLSQAKGVLEYTLWGPADIAFGNSNRERESALQRWLDLERATVLHGLVRTRAELTVFEEWQLLFLVRTNAKMMVEASFLLESGVNEEVSTA